MKFHLDKIIKEKGITAEQIELGADVPSATLSRIRRNVSHEPLLRNIEKICNFLNITPNDLFGWNGESED